MIAYLCLLSLVGRFMHLVCIDVVACSCSTCLLSLRAISHYIESQKDPNIDHERSRLFA